MAPNESITASQTPMLLDFGNALPLTTKAGDMLREAADAVDGDRNSTHGDKERSFHAIAQDWTAYLATRKDPAGPIRPRDVAHMMNRLKQQRAEWGTAVRDHFVDAAGYAAIAGELEN